MRIALFCIGNKLMLDDGLGIYVYEELNAYDFIDGEHTLEIFEAACLTMDLINVVDTYDLIITVDAVDGTGLTPGTIVRYTPDELQGRSFGSQSLHDLRLSDLFDAAALLGFKSQGICLGMQVVNPSPDPVCMGLTAPVFEKLGMLTDCVLAEIVGAGVRVIERASGQEVTPGFQHRVRLRLDD